MAGEPGLPSIPVRQKISINSIIAVRYQRDFLGSFLDSSAATADPTGHHSLHQPASGKPNRPYSTSNRANAVAQFQTRFPVRNFERQRALVALRWIGRGIAESQFRWIAPNGYVCPLPREWNLTDNMGHSVFALETRLEIFVARQIDFQNGFT